MNASWYRSADPLRDSEHLQVAVDRFRRQRGITSRADTLAWLDLHGLTVADLADLVAQKVRSRGVVGRVLAGRPRTHPGRTPGGTQSSRADVRPNLFIVGAPKCGTTSMYRYLREHPQIYMSPLKEPDYFCFDLNVSPYYQVDTEADYLRLFEGSESSPIRGESSTLYLYSRVAAKEIRRFAPDARIVIMLRNPIDFMYSQHRQFVMRLSEDIEDFETALRAEPQRATGATPMATTEFAECLQYQRFARFSEQVSRYLEVFPRDRVKIILLEDLARDTGAVFSDTLRFLRLDDVHARDLRPYNVTAEKTASNLAAKRYLNAHPLLRHLVSRIPLGARTRLDRAIATVWRTHVRFTEAMPARLRATLVTEFSSEIEALSGLIGRDLAHWRRTAPVVAS